MADNTLVTAGPNKTAPKPVPVGWDELPVTDGSFNEDNININAPETARRGFDSGFLSVNLLILTTPYETTGMDNAYQNKHHCQGKNPSMMCS